MPDATAVPAVLVLDAAWTRRQAGHIMGTIDITNATRPRRTRVGGVAKTRMAHFRNAGT